MSLQTDVIVAEIVRDNACLSTQELLDACSITPQFLRLLVAEEIVRPLGAGFANWRFSRSQLSRVAKAQRIDRELGPDSSSLALILDLVDEIESLRMQLRV